MTAIFVPMEERVYQTPLDTSAFVTEDLQAWSVKVSHITKYIIKLFSFFFTEKKSGLQRDSNP